MNNDTERRLETRTTAEISGVQPDDTELVSNAARGDASAFHALVDRHAPHLFRLACMLSRSHADAEDIVQETFAGAFAGLAKFNGQSSVKTWLSRILTRQAARSWHRTRRTRGMAQLDETTGGADAGLSVPSAATAVDRKIDVAAMLKMLSPDFREVLVLRELQGLSYGEIAESLGIPQGTVESRLHRARAELRRRMQGYEP